MEQKQDRTEVVRSLLVEYGEYQSELTAIEATMKDIKGRIQAEMGDDTKMAFDHLGSIQKVASSTVVSYDADAVISVVLKALQENDIHTVIALVRAVSSFDSAKVDRVGMNALSDGQIAISKSLTDARKESTRAGSMRITLK